MVLDIKCDTTSGKSQIAFATIYGELYTLQLGTSLTILGSINLNSSIDDFLTSQCVLDWWPRASIGTKVLSDHTPVFMSVKLPNSIRPQTN